MTNTLSQLEIKNMIIHRYENFLIDTVEPCPGEEIKGSLSVTITDSDPLGRDIFFKNIGKSSSLISTVHMEILALGSIACTGPVAKDHMVIFTGISNFKVYQPFPLNNTLTGKFEKISDKAGFIRYKGSTYLGDTCLSSGEMMALHTKVDTKSESKQKTIEIPNLPLKKTFPVQESLKPKSMTLSDYIRLVTETSCITSYTYPTTHPFIKGHFPENPLMMGVMQWSSVEDTCYAFYTESGLSGDVTLSFSAVLVRPNGKLVADIKQCSVLCTTSENGINCSIIETKKITFRDMVRPTEEIYIYLSNIIQQ
jgi:3-hydroxymyristoyl/3-hydroxydecanoyl-(acyl carrier protein) dehydratase